MKPLRIFYAVSKTPNAEVLHSSNLWHLNLYPPLIELGHEVIQFDYDFTEHFNYFDLHNPDHQAFIATKRPILERRLVDQIQEVHRQKPIDLFFSYLYDAFINPEVIDEIRQMGILTVNFYCNAAHQFYLIENIAPRYDYCMVPELQAIPKYEAIGAKPIHIQMAASPAFYKPYPLPHRYPVTFVGQRYLNRPELMAYLLGNGISVYAWGPGWRDRETRTPTQRFWRLVRQTKRLVVGPHEKLSGTPPFPLRRCGPPLSDEGLVRMYSRSRISLNFSEVRDQVSGETKRHIRLRDFEAPMSGAFYFTGYQDELQTYYEIGKEIICYDSKEELLDKVRYYLNHDSEAQGIREAGLRRAQRDHTWKNRFVQLFAAIGLK